MADNERGAPCAPLPWKLDGLELRDANDQWLTTFRTGIGKGRQAEAELTVRAVNAYEPTLKALMRYGSHDNSCDAANPTSEEKHECTCGLWEAQAIAKAEGK